MLAHKLKPLDRYLSKPNLAELYANEPGALWLEFADGTKRKEPTPQLDLEYWRSLARILSNTLGLIGFNKKPYLAAVLPGRHRLQLCLGRSVPSGLSASIRVFRPRNKTIYDFGLSEPDIERIKRAILAKKNIVISGGTFTGKTTFADALTKEVPRDDRTLLVEDTPEIDLSHLPDSNSWVVNRLATEEDIQYQDVIDAFTRSRPDRIIVGELSILNTWILLRLLNVGHGGLITTLHANSPELAFSTLTRNVQLSGKPADGVEEFFRTTVDMVIQLTRDPETNRRFVSAIYEPPR